LTALRNESNNYMMQLTDVVGLNNTDASTPDRISWDSKMAAYNSNLATRHILDGNGI
jgi:hypothetical protein